MRAEYDILVLGCGPAACVSALHLNRLGYSTALIGQPRREPLAEGLSARVVEGLRHANCLNAVNILGEPVARNANWNGERRAPNREYIVDRSQLDAALLEDARAAGVHIFEGKVTGVQSGADGWRGQLMDSQGQTSFCTGRFLIEARGRRAPRNRGLALRGSRTIALLRPYKKCSEGHPATAVASFPNGWAWHVNFGDGRCVLQIVVSASAARSGGKGNLSSQFDKFAGQIMEAEDWLEAKAVPNGEVRARDATAYLHRAPIDERALRVGDAAFGIDPLSGHGIFEAVGGAMAAAPVVNTLLKRPKDRKIATSFYADRARSAFLQHARVGRDFYRQEERWADRLFWAARLDWPDDLPTHDQVPSLPTQIRTVPVIEDDFIVRREVVVTPDYPRGVRFVSGVPVVDLIDLVDQSTTVQGVDQVAGKIQKPANDVTTAIAWLQSQKMLGVDGHTLTASAARLRDNGKGRRDDQ